MVTAFLGCIVSMSSVLDTIAGTGIDAAMFGDDRAHQTHVLSPEAFRGCFSAVRRIRCVSRARHGDFVHSCGYIYNFISMFIEAGVDVFQFDQPMHITERLSEEFSDRAVFHSPVDIQKVLPTGDLELIGRRAAEMYEIFGKTKPGWRRLSYHHDIGVDPAWAKRINRHHRAHKLSRTGKWPDTGHPQTEKACAILEKFLS